MPEPLHPDDPPVIGPYRLNGRLGVGGQGVVYLGQARDGRYVAVKVLHAAVSDQVLERFAKEVAAARRVEPFCVAQVLDASFEGRRPYIVTEFVEGLSLQQAGVHHGPALHRMAVSTATALAAVHRAGIVHRDFKPANVLLAKDGPRVIDFGIARDTEASLTVTSSIVGTPSYMAPEQLGGHYTGPAADVFAWGSVMVYAATGRPPFGVDHLPAVISRILYAAPDLGDMAEPLRSIVTNCLAKEPSRRPTMQDVLLQLLGQQRVRPTAPSELVADTRPTARSTPLRTGLLVGGTAIVVTSVTVTVTLLLGLPGQGPNRAADGATSSPVTEASESQGKQARDPSRSTPKSSPKRTSKKTPTSSPTRPSPTKSSPTEPATESTPSPADSAPEAFVFGSLAAQGSKNGTCYESGVRVRFRGRILDDAEPIVHRWVIDGRQRGGTTTSYSPTGPWEAVTQEGISEPGTHTATFWVLKPGARRSKTIQIKVC
ncbi:protein kinase domain-containing protein [Nonomuraea sp. CA-143628]|uniref:serine/threonine-protein kinase n=1 Tax=Nonomuraea sp. CA-143628 TaxID=3239997 RepID=UPI003D8C95CD